MSIIIKQQVIDFGGIVDKVKDYVEKAHQIGKKLDHFTSSLKSNEYEHKQNILMKQMLLHCNDDVQEQIEMANQLLKQKFIITH